MNHVLLAGNSQKEEAELVTIFLVLVASRAETLCVVCFGPGNGKVKISELDRMQVAVLFIREEYLKCSIVSSLLLM